MRKFTGFEALGEKKPQDKYPCPSQGPAVGATAAGSGMPIGSLGSSTLTVGKRKERADTL